MNLINELEGKTDTFIGLDNSNPFGRLNFKVLFTVWDTNWLFLSIELFGSELGILSLRLTYVKELTGELSVKR